MDLRQRDFFYGPHNEKATNGIIYATYQYLFGFLYLCVIFLKRLHLEF